VGTFDEHDRGTYVITNTIKARRACGAATAPDDGQPAERPDAVLDRYGQ